MTETQVPDDIGMGGMGAAANILAEITMPGVLKRARELKL